MIFDDGRGCALTGGDSVDFVGVLGCSSSIWVVAGLGLRWVCGGMYGYGISMVFMELGSWDHAVASYLPVVMPFRIKASSDWVDDVSDEISCR